ncbi:MAG: chemotaxis protein CheW [Actinotalea sp.]|nr:chemotaxis protein CheW [Actinotalea sp.]
MSTLTTHHERPSSLREAVRWYREAPAPRWEEGAAKKATFAGYLGGSVVAWVMLGLLGAIGVNGLVELLASAF